MIIRYSYFRVKRLEQEAARLSREGMVGQAEYCRIEARVLRAELDRRGAK